MADIYKKTFYLICHVQTLFNRQKKIQGFCDLHLTDLKIKKARIARSYFINNNIKFDKGFKNCSIFKIEYENNIFCLKEIIGHDFDGLSDI